MIIADEPTTALDVIVQDRILRELKRIQQELRMYIIYISHDIAVAAEVTDRIGVMYAGSLVELGDIPDVFRAPIHPYTAALMSSSPSVSGEKRPLATLPGRPPGPASRLDRSTTGLPLPSPLPPRYRGVPGRTASPG